MLNYPHMKREKLLDVANINNPRMTFWFARHAESEGNSQGELCPVNHDTPLTSTGEQQAKELLQYFQDNDITITDVYSSPLQRATQTASVVAGHFGVPVNELEDLRGRDWGEWCNQTWQEVSVELESKSIDERYTFIPEGGESWEEMEERLFDALETIAKENEAGEDILIVTHKGALRAMLPILDQVEKERHKDYSVGVGSLTAFSFDKQDFHFIGLMPSESVKEQIVTESEE
jgi:broad specificity phosphatase PhoE